VTTAIASPASLADRTRGAVATVLGRAADAIAVDVPLTLYGLDSVNALELIAALEEIAGRPLPEWLIADYPTLGDLIAALDSESDAPADLRALIDADGHLPDDVWPPPGEPRRPARHVLVTGATGFLGAFLVRQLLETTDAHVCCLVRNGRGDAAALARVRNNLAQYGLWTDHHEHRLSISSGDLTQPQFGLAPAEYEALAGRVDVVFHAAGDVSWVQPYASLRHVNVLGTLEVLRFAAAGQTKSIQFVSSLSVCYATGGPATVDEDTDMRPWVHDLALGYAQTKLVAESLVQQAQQRGFDAGLYRPSIILGDAATGASNLDDIVAALLKGCIEMGTAPDLDWVLDGPPVDHVARAIIRLSAQPGGRAPGPMHLNADRPRHWRECLLWTTLFGYPVRLVPFAQWQEQLRVDAVAPTHPLHALRPFFLRPVSGRLTSAELFEARHRSATRRRHSRDAEASVGLTCPRLDAQTLDRYFSNFTSRGFLPSAPVSCDAPGPCGAGHPTLSEAVATALGVHYGDATLSISDLTVVERGSDHSIVSELTSWRRDRQHGLFHWHLSLLSSTAPGHLAVVVKNKPTDDDVIEVAEAVAHLCDGPLADVMRVHRNALGLRGSHAREQSVYAAAPDAVRLRMPACLGAWSDDAGQTHGLVLEHVADVELMDAADDPAQWSPVHREIVIDGMAAMHAAWQPQVDALRHAPWIGDLASTTSMVVGQPLWRELARHAAPEVARWGGSRAGAIHAALVESVGRWWPALEASPQTVIHHDFNPRNLCLRRKAGVLQLCAYDWELATIGAPQRDLAEFLCFTLDDDCAAAIVEGHSEDHRRRLVELSGTPIDPARWRAGLQSALADMLIRRLAFYALVHRVRRQSFLPRVVRTWLHLYDLLGGAPG
jgi:thioester reductase-like protein